MVLESRSVVFLRTSSVARIPVYAHLRSLGLKMVVVHPNLNDAFEGLFDHWIVHDTNDIDALERVLDTELPRLGVCPDAILSFDEYAVYPAACLAQRRGLRPIPLPPSAIAHTSVKSDFRSFCDAHGINSPRYCPVRSCTDDLDALMRGMTFPVVVKPSPGAGSLLAKLCGTMEELAQHAAHMWRVLSAHPDAKHYLALGSPVHLLVEEYIGGQEVDIDCVVENGVVRFASISDNFEVCPPYFVEQGGLCPSALPEHAKSALMELLHSFVRAHGAALHGVLHFEAKYDFARERAYVVEVNCRLGSAETNTMISTVYGGLQLGECLVRLGLNLPLTNLREEHRTPITHCASVNIYPEQEGVLSNLEVPTSDKSLVAFSVSAQPGQYVAPPPKTFYLLCWMVADGATAAAAVNNIRRIKEAFVQEVHTPQ